MVRSSSLLTDEEKTERRRRMNVIHSRRKRERERISLEVLKEQCSQLNDQNNALKVENKRFEEVIEYAKKKIPNWDELELNTTQLDGVKSRVSSKEAVEQPDDEQPESGKALDELTEEERKERKRKQNAIHSQRKRERERIEIEVLNVQCDELREQNEALSRENKRFEDLLESAIAHVDQPVASSSLV